MLIRCIIDIFLLEEIHQEFVVALRRGYDVAFNAVVAGYFGCPGFDGDLADLGCNRVLGDIAEWTGNRLNQLVQKSLGFIRPQRAAPFHPVILPIQLGFAVGLRQHLQELAEHEKSTDAHQSEHDPSPERDGIHEP